LKKRIAKMMTTTTTAISTQFAVVMPKEYAFGEANAG
jgi:hypothetical protein